MNKLTERITIILLLITTFVAFGMAGIEDYNQTNRYNAGRGILRDN